MAYSVEEGLPSPELNLIVMWFSRRREYRADEGGAKLASRDSMIGALEALRAHADVEALFADDGSGDEG